MQRKLIGIVINLSMVVCTSLIVYLQKESKYAFFRQSLEISNFQRYLFHRVGNVQNLSRKYFFPVEVTTRKWKKNIYIYILYWIVLKFLFATLYFTFPCVIVRPNTWRLLALSSPEVSHKHNHRAWHYPIAGTQTSSLNGWFNMNFTHRGRNREGILIEGS